MCLARRKLLRALEGSAVREARATARRIMMFPSKEGPRSHQEQQNHFFVHTDGFNHGKPW